MSTSQRKEVPVERIVGRAVKEWILPPGPEREEELPFRRRRMVGWFDPAQLSRTALRALLSELFGEYADKREVQAALSRPGVHDYSGADGRYTDDNGDLWLDYLADLGDGFDSTYSVAWLLSRPELRLGGMEEATRRGRILVLGGDQVYPTASRTEYQERFAGPYEAALPCAPEAVAPHLFALPGNHDWYDGLTSFVRLFCQERWIGGWKTRQSRSYFALKLTHGWWLWGVDIALAADIDEPQLAYFRDVARNRMAEGDRIILCTAEPSWVFSGMHDPDAFRNLAFFERDVVRAEGRTIAVTLTGDMHHYARYERKEGGGEHRFTAGGGGAYLVATHHLPDELRLTYRKPRDGQRFFPEEEQVVYERRAEYPSAEESRELVRGARRFGPLNRTFGRLLGGAYAVLGGLYYGLLNSVVGLSPDAGTETGLPQATLLAPGLMDLIALPLFVILALVFLGGLYGLASLTPGISPRAALRASAPHWAAHMVVLMLATGLLFAAGGALPLPDGSSEGAAIRAGMAAAVMLILGVVGARAGAWIVGRYLVWADSRGINVNEAFSAQRIEDYKNFLRLRIDANGDLTVFPVKVPTICRRWAFVPAAEPGASFFRPLDGMSPELIERPIIVRHPHNARAETETAR